MMNKMIKTPIFKLRSLTILNSIHTHTHTRSISLETEKNTFFTANQIHNLLEKCTCMSQLFQVQSQMIKTGLLFKDFVSSRLIAFCALSDAGDLSYGLRILRLLDNPIVHSWNYVIKGYSQSLNPVKAIDLYKEMLVTGSCRPDNYTYPILFKACTQLCSCFMGHMVFGHVLKLGFESDNFVRNGVLNMLLSCGRLEDAHQVFDESPVRNLVTWSTLINGYVHCGKASEALKLFEEMMLNGVKPDEVTMIGMVSSCTQLKDLNRGVEFHNLIVDYGLKFTVNLCNALINMYSECGDVQSARVIFDGMWNKNTVSWNTMIGGYVKAMRCKTALNLFNEMLETNSMPDKVTMMYCLMACTHLDAHQALNTGIWIHSYIKNESIPLDVELGALLVDMYAKCGNIDKALEVFQELPVKESQSWTSIIRGLAFNGFANDALSHFDKMVESGLKPDETTFVGVLAACCHAGLVNEGCNYFDQMTSTYNLTPNRKHYSSMVALLGKAGKLEEAEALIMSMPMEPSINVWRALLFACRMHGNAEMGEKAARKLFELDPEVSGGYDTLASMYEDAGRLDEASQVRNMMEISEVDKPPSGIQVTAV